MNFIGWVWFCGDVRLSSGSGLLTLTLVLTSDAKDSNMLHARIPIRSEMENVVQSLFIYLESKQGI